MELMNWYTNIPFYTRTWLTSTVIVTFLGTFGVINPYYLTLDAPLLYKLQIWRPITGLLFYPLEAEVWGYFGFHFIINCFLLYRYSRRLEKITIYSGHPEDYFIMLKFNWTCCFIIGSVIESPSSMELMVFSVMGVWCDLNKHVAEINICGHPLKAKYFQWVLVALKGIIKGGVIHELLGILVGHLSVVILCLKEIT